MKKSIDIEKLLQWAMRDELPKGQAVSSAPWDLITRFGQLGVTVQSGGYGDGFGFVPGAPHADALVVADAIAALDTSARFNDAEDVSMLFGEWAGIAGDATASIMMAVFDPRSIILSKAIQSTRPKWDFECPTPYRVFIPCADGADGRPRAMVHGTDADGDVVYLHQRQGRAAMRDGLYDYAMLPRSPISWGDPSMISIGHSRAEYVAWYGALIALAKTLKGKLAEYEPTAPAVMPTPWITGQTPVSRVLSDGKSPGLFTAKLPLAPKRTAAGRPVESAIESESRRAYRRAPKAKNEETTAAQ
jgi:hypothetical protein